MNDPGIDLTGKLIIKVALGDDIRRILITNEDITYDELVLMMQRVYRGKLNSSDDIVIKYKDEDNDLITIFDSSDMNFAIQCSRILKITLFVNGKPEPLQTDEVKMIKSELKHIRDRCNQLLDKLDDRQPSDTPSSTVDSSSSSKVVPPKVSESPQRASPRPSYVPPTSQVGSKEFDPLSSQRSVEEQQNKVMSSFGISNDVTERPGTPDSVSSIGSSSSRQQQQPQGPQAPAQQGGQASPYPQGTAAGGGQKVPPWQQQQPGQPSSYQGTQEANMPASMKANKVASWSSFQNTRAGRDGPHEFSSNQRSLMQSQAYTGHVHDHSGARASAQQPQSSYPTASTPQQQPGYPAQTSQPAPGQAQTSQYGPGYGQQAQAGAQPSAQPGVQPGQQPCTQPGQQPGTLPGQQQPGALPGQQQPGALPGQQQQPGALPGQQHPGYQQPGYGMMSPQQQQMSMPSQQQQAQGQQGQAPQQQGAPQGSPYGYQQQAPQPGPGGPPGPPAPGGNPYARQGPGYGAGYPRPTGNYPQGYQ